MRNLFIITSVLFLSAGSFFLANHLDKTKQEISGVKNAGEAGIVFIEEDWKLAQEKAHLENKLIFLDIYATWCGHAKC